MRGIGGWRTLKREPSITDDSEKDVLRPRLRKQYVILREQKADFVAAMEVVLGSTSCRMTHVVPSSAPANSPSN